MFTKKQHIGRNCLKGGLRQFSDLSVVEGLVKKIGGGGSSWGERLYPNAHFETGNNFNCDINLLVPMSSLLILNRTVLSCNWLATKNNFWCRQGAKKCKFQMHHLDKKTLSFSNLTRFFLTKCELVYKNPVKRSVLKSQFQNPRNLDEKTDFFWHNSY